MRSITDAIQEREIRAERLKDQIEKLREAVRILEEGDPQPLQSGPSPVPVPPKRWP